MVPMLCNHCQHLHAEVMHFDLVRIEFGGEGERKETVTPNKTQQPSERFVFQAVLRF